MAITPIQPPRAITPPSIAPIPPPALELARDGPLRVVVWFRADVALPDDDIVCAPDAMDALFGPGIAQRLLMTPATAWLQRALPGGLAAALDQSARGGDAEDIVASTPYAHIYLLRLTGGLGARHVSDVLSASPSVAMAYPEPTVSVAGIPSKYKTSPVFIAGQEYLEAGTGINAEPVWAKGYTGATVQAAVLDTDANVSSQVFQVRQVKAPAAPATPSTTPASSQVSTHALFSLGIIGAPDNNTVGVGVAPDVSLVFAPIEAIGTMSFQKVHTAFANLLAQGGLKPGDVVNASLALSAGLDVNRPYARYDDVLKANKRFPGKQLVTSMVGTEKRPSGVATAAPIEIEPTLAKLVADFAKAGVTVVEAAGNGMAAAYSPDGTAKNESWGHTGWGADLSGPWQAGDQKVPLAAFTAGLSKTPRSLDRAATATFADGGGIVVAGGQFSPSKAGMIDNVGFNHGSRVDCYAIAPEGHLLGFDGPPRPSGPPISGTSVCAPVIAGVVAVVQSIAKATFGASLRPAIVRALLSDPQLGTATVAGRPVGVMPDLVKLTTFLEAPQGKRHVLAKAIEGRQQAMATLVKAAAGASSGFVHNPYTQFTKAQASAGQWVPLTIDSNTVFS